MEKNKRVDYLDVARGVALFLVILGHTYVDYYVNRFCFLVNLPIFIMISGYFFKKEDSIRQILKKSVKIIIPTLVVYLISRVIDIYILGREYTIFKDLLFSLSKNTLFKGVYSIGILWFIPFLIILKIVFCIINKISRNNKYITAGLVLILTCCGIYLSQNKYCLPWNIDSVLSSLVIFYIGQVLKEKDILEKHIDDKIFWLIPTVIFWVIFSFVEIDYWSFELVARIISPLGVFLSCIGCLMMIKFSYIIQKHSKMTSKCLGWIGRNSYLIYISHFIESRYIVPNYWISVSFWIAFPAKVISTMFITGFMYYLRSQIRDVKNIIEEKKKGERNEQVS